MLGAILLREGKGREGKAMEGKGGGGGKGKRMGRHAQGLVDTPCSKSWKIPWVGFFTVTVPRGDDDVITSSL